MRHLSKNGSGIPTSHRSPVTVLPVWTYHLCSGRLLKEEEEKMRTRTHTRALFGALLAVVALGAACKKPVVQAPPPPPPPVVAPPARPTVTLQASSTLIQSGEAVTLTWSSTNATSLSLSPGVGNVAAEGSTRVTPTESTSYTITATGPGGTADANARVSVTAAAPAPTTSRDSTMQELFAKEVKDAYF